MRYALCLCVRCLTGRSASVSFVASISMLVFEIHTVFMFEAAHRDTPLVATALLPVRHTHCVGVRYLTGRGTPVAGWLAG